MASMASTVQAEVTQANSDKQQPVRHALAAIRGLWLFLATALGLATGLLAFGTVPAFAASCPNGTDLFSGLNTSSVVAGSSAGNITFNYAPPCGFATAANGSHLYIAVPAPASGTNWTTPFGMAGPTAPTLATSTTTGTLSNVSYLVEISYHYTACACEGLPSANSSVTPTANKSFTVSAPSQPSGVDGWYVYVKKTGDTNFTSQDSHTKNTSFSTAITVSAYATSGTQPQSTISSAGAVVASIPLSWDKPNSGNTATACPGTFGSAATTCGTDTSSTITIYGSGSVSNPWIIDVELPSTVQAMDQSGSTCGGTNWAGTATSEGCSMSITWYNPVVQTLAADANTSPTSGMFALGACNVGNGTDITQTCPTSSVTIATTNAGTSAGKGTTTFWMEGGTSAAPTCTLSGGGGSGATCTATVAITGTAVSGLTIATAGSGYTSAPTCTLTGVGAGSGATCTATITAGAVSSLSVSAGGSGYISCSACVQAIPIYPAAVNSLVASGVPSSVTAGTAFSFTLTAEDSFGNVNNIGPNVDNSAITLSTTDSQGVVPTNATFALGTAAVSDITLYTASTTGFTITATSGGKNVTTASIPVNAAAVSKLAVTLPAGATAGTAFNMTVTAQDQYGNTVSSGTSSPYTSTVTFTTSDSSTNASKILPSGTCGSNCYTFVSGDGGSHLFTNGVTLVTSGTISITAVDNTKHVSGTSTIPITAATATSLSFSSPPSTASAGTAFSLTVQAKDQFGNLASSYTGTIAFTISDPSGTTGDVKFSEGGSCTTDYCFVAGDAGTHTFTNGFTLVHVGSPSITAADTVTTSLTTGAQTFSVTSNLAATKLNVSITNGESGTNQATAGTALTLSVSATDTYGNVVSSGLNASDTIDFVSTDGSASLPAAGATTLSAGTATVSVTFKTAPASNQTITACDVSTHPSFTSDNSTCSVASPTVARATTSPVLSVIVGAASKLVFTTSPSCSSPPTCGGGQSFDQQPVVKVEDSSGNLVSTGTDSTDSIALSISAGTCTGASLGGTTTISAVAGVANWSTNPGVTTPLFINLAPVTCKLQASSGTLASATSSSFTVSVGNAAKLAFTTSPGGTITGGTAFGTQPVVAIQDAGGNTVTGNTSTVTLAITGGTGTSGAAITNNTKAAAAGVATFTAATIDLAGTNYTLTATDGSLTSASSQAFNVTVGSAAKLVFSVEPACASPTCSGGLVFSTQPVVQVQDAGGNAVTASSVSVAITIDSSSTGTGTLGGTTTVGSDTSNNGKATFTNLFINKSSPTGTYFLKAASGSISTVSTPSFTVLTGSAAKLAFTTSPGGTLTGGTAFGTQPKVTVQDAGGNTVTGDSSTVTLSIVSGTGTSGAALTTTSQSESAGVITFVGAKIDKSGTNYQLLATDSVGGVSTATSSAFSITVGGAAQLVFTTQPSNISGGSAFSPQPAVQIQDAGGNPVLCVTSTPCAGGSVTLAIGTNAGTPAGTLSPSNALSVTTSTSTGIATFSSLSIDKAGTGYTLAASFSTIGATSSTFNVTVGSPTQLSFTTSPGCTGAGCKITGGTAFGVQPVVALLDAGGNTTTSTNSVLIEISSGTGASGAVLSGTTTLAAVNGVVDWSTAATKLSINLSSSTPYALVALSGSLASATSSNFTVQVGSAAQLVFSTQPAGNITGGSAFPTQPKVTVEDAGGNTITGTGTSVNVTLSITPSTGTSGAIIGPAGNLTVASVTTTGVATFSGIEIDKVGSNYQIRASSGALSTADSQQFTVSSGSPTNLTYTTQPGCTTGCPAGGQAQGGTAFGTQPVVAVSDAGGNPVTGIPVSITLSIKSGSGTSGAALGGTTTQAVNTSTGSATFSGLSIDKAGAAYILTATAGSINVNSSSFTVVVGPAAKLTFSTQPGGTLTGGTAFGTQPVVTVADAGGNTVTGDSSTVTLAITTGTGTSGATLTTGSQSETSGAVTFSGVKIDKAGTNYQLTATDGSLTSATSNAFTILVGGASQLVFTTQPGCSGASCTITGGTAFGLQPAVQVQDAGGNPITASSVNVTLAIGTDPSSGTASLSGTKTVGSSTSTGIATFNGLSINKAFNGYTLAATASGTGGATSSSFNVVPGSAVALSFSTSPSTSSGGSALAPQPVVTITDAGGNTASGATNNVVLSISTGTGTSGAVLSGTTTLAAVSGVATFSGLSINKVGTAYQLAAQSGTLTPATSTAFDINAGGAAKLAFTTQPGGTITGGTTFPTQPVVTVQDLGGNTVTGSSAQITLAIGTNPSTGTLSATTNPLTATSGVATFGGTKINFAGNGYTLTASSSGLTPATSSSFNVNVGSAAQLVFTTQPGCTGAGCQITGGSPFGVQPAVTVEDAGGNPVTGSAVSVTVSIQSGTGTTGAALSGTTTVGTSTSTGTAGFSGLSIDKQGSGYALTATSGSVSANSSTFTVSVGSPAKLVFTQQPGGSITGGTAFPTQPVISVQDAGGNTVTGDSSTVTLVIKTGTGTSGATLTAGTQGETSGAVTFSGVKIDKSGTNYQLHATDGSLTAVDSNAFNISVGTASQLLFTTQPASSTGGVALPTQPAVQVQDAGGNPITASSVNVTVAIGTNPGTGTLSGTKTVGSSTATGVATFNGLAIDKIGTGYTLTAAASGTGGATSSTFNVTTGPVSTMVFTQQPSSSTGGVPFGTQPQVTVSDAGGNIVISASNTVVLSIAQGTGATGASLGGTISAPASSGVATFSGLSIDKASGTAYQLVAQSGALTPAVSTAFNITSGPASKLAFTTPPGGTITGGTAFPTQPAVAVEDAGGNPVSSAATVAIAIKAGTGQSGAVLSGTTSLAAVNGVADWSTAATKLSINLISGGVAYQLEATSSPLSPVDSSGFFVNTGPATQLAFQSEPAGATGGVAFTTQPTVVLEDAGGNQAAASGTVTMTIATGTGTSGATLGGTVTANAVNGLAIFTSLKIDKMGTAYQLHAASGSMTTNSTAFDVAGGPAVAMTFSTSPAGALGGAAFTTQPMVTFTDAGGNTASSSASVSLSITPGTGTSGAQLGGTVTVSASNGIATFGSVKIDKAGTNYTLTASSTAAPSASSQAFNVNIGPEAQMVIITQPITAAVNSVMSPVVVELRDAGGNTVIASTMPVTVSLGNAGTAVLGGTVTRAPSSGDATFNDLTVNATGNGYTLTFNAGSLQSVTSSTFNVTSFTLALHPSNGPAGTQVAVSGTQWPQNSTVIITLGGTPMTTSPSPCPTDNSGTFGPCLITIPALNNGPANIIVTDNGGANHFTQVFTVTGGAGVVITKITPNVYAPKPASKACPSGTCINLVGVGFTGVTGPNQILFVKPDGSTAPAAALTAIDAKGGRTMTIVPPTLPNIGPTHIEIVTSHGNSDPTDPNSLFSYGPYIKKITPGFFTPPIGKSTGTTKVTITGLNFTGVDDPSQIMFGSVPATSIISGGSFISTNPAPKTIPPKPKDTSLIVVPPPLTSEPAGTDCVRVTINTIPGSVGATTESNAPATYHAPAGGGGPSSTVPDAAQFCWGSDVVKVSPTIGPANGIDPKKLTPVVVTISGGDLGESLIGISLGSGGSGYTRAPACKLTGGGGKGGACSATVTSGVVTAVSLTNAGGGYLSAPTCTLTGTGTGATCTVSVPVKTTVKFGSAVACAPSGTPAVCTVTAGKLIKVNLPAQASGDPEMVPVTVTTVGGVGAGSSGSVTVGTFTYGGVVNSITLTSVKKITTKTPVLTTTFTVAGKNLNNATEIDFTQSGSVKACLVLSSSATQCAAGQTPNNNPATGTTSTNTGTKLAVVIPSANLTLAAGTYDVEVLTPAGASQTSSKDLFTTTGI